MLQEFHSGTLDLILTPHCGNQHNLEFIPVTLERTVLVCGNQTQTDELQKIIEYGSKEKAGNWLRQQIWYTTTDKDYLKRFWAHHFDMLPAFQPNYVLPYFSSVLRGLRNGEGFAVVPEFLCEDDLVNGTIKYAWEGGSPLEHTLYFGKRKKTQYSTELKQLEILLIKKLCKQNIEPLRQKPVGVQIDQIALQTAKVATSGV
jgi:DNA-binding transcriptional LysR family regulator